MKSIPVSLIVTVYNEKDSITSFLKSVINQTVLPREVIIVDGGSKDNTADQINNFIKENKLNIKLFKKRGNRSVGRNEAIRRAKNEIILCSDAGCTLDRKWIENITKPFNREDTDVVAGYYKGKPANVFQKSLIPFVLVMEDKLNEKDFLPATRSVAFKKSVWKKIGGFNERLSHNEDFVFANKLKKINANIVFAKDAIVFWVPRKNLKQTFVMFFRFAFGDAESGFFRDKVLLIFARYLFFPYLLSLAVIEKSVFLFTLSVLLPVLYIVWAIKKNFRYVKEKQGYIYLPVLQIVSDVAVLAGTFIGTIKFILKKNYKSIVKSNWMLLLSVLIYIASMLWVINIGIPNVNHPFPYQMDEWHQSQSVRNVFKFGTPNLSGSANGTMFHFYLSGIMLIPFILLKFVNPFAIKSAVDSLPTQETLFVIFRLNTLFFGVLTLVVLQRLLKLLKLNSALGILLFFITPVFLTLSNYFKYDIALVFWMVLSVYFFIKYFYDQSLKSFLIGSAAAGFALGIKVTGITMLPVIILAFIFLTQKASKRISLLFMGISTFIFITVFFAIPDIIFAGKSMYQYIYDNTVLTGSIVKNYTLGIPTQNYLLLHTLPEIFGHFLFFLSLISIVFYIYSIIRDFRKKKMDNFRIKSFLFSSFIVFALSIYTLNIFLSANRAIVVLPFFVIFILTLISRIFYVKKTYLRYFLITVFIILFLVQIFESYMWVKLKFNTPQELSSAWILKNIPKNSDIGLENIPIYQFEPDFILKEFYLKQQDPGIKTLYNYSIINSNSEKLPNYVVISNMNYEHKFLKVSAKNDLVKRLSKEKYIKVANFLLNLPQYRFFDNYFYYPYVGLFAYPESIAVFKK